MPLLNHIGVGALQDQYSYPTPKDPHVLGIPRIGAHHMLIAGKVLPYKMIGGGTRKYLEDCGISISPSNKPSDRNKGISFGGSVIFTEVVLPEKWRICCTEYGDDKYALLDEQGRVRAWITYQPGSASLELNCRFDVCISAFRPGCITATVFDHHTGKEVYNCVRKYTGKRGSKGYHRAYDSAKYSCAKFLSSIGHKEWRSPFLYWG